MCKFHNVRVSYFSKNKIYFKLNDEIIFGNFQLKTPRTYWCYNVTAQQIL